jgi:hypothetical protein
MHGMLVLPACRILDLQGHGGFHPDFRRKPGRPGNVWQGWSSYRQPLREQCVKLWRWSLICNGDPRYGKCQKCRISTEE